MTIQSQSNERDLTPWIAGSVAHRLVGLLGTIPLDIEFLRDKLEGIDKPHGYLDTQSLLQELSSMNSNVQLAMDTVEQDSTPWLAEPVRRRLQRILSAMALTLGEMMTKVQEGPSAPYLEQQLDELKNEASNVLQFVERMRIPANGTAIVALAEPADVRSLVDEAIAKCTIPRNIELMTDLGDQALLVSNRRGIVEVLTNLLRNAVEAMPSGGRLAISLHGPDIHQQVNIYVADTGRGIPEHLKPTLFEPSFSSKPGGHGVGLWLSRHLLHRLDGNLYLQESEVGVGSTFVVTIPISSEARKENANE